MPFISDTQIAKVQSTIGGLAARANRAREKAEQKAGDMKKVAEIVGGGAAIGFVRGKWEANGDAFVVPGTSIDMQLAAGLALSGAAMFEVFGKYDQDALNVGSGVLAHYAGQILRNYGKRAVGDTSPISYIAGHNYPTMAGGPTSFISGGPTSLIGAHGGMSSALQSALSASV